MTCLISPLSVVQAPRVLTIAVWIELEISPRSGQRAERARRRHHGRRHVRDRGQPLDLD
jgi:hypothetical protein